MKPFHISNELGATGFAILAGLSALFFGLWYQGAAGTGDGDKDTIQPIPVTAERNAAIEAQLAAAKADLEEEAARRSDLALELNDSQASIAALEETNASLRIKAAKAESLQKTLSETRATLAAERESCANAKQALEDKIDALSRELDQTKYADQLKPAADFPALELPFLINNPLELDGKARPLFIKLREFKGSPDEREKIYAELANEGKTKPLHRVQFGSGSSEVSEEEASKLAEQIGQLPDDSAYLVVGYASGDGQPKSNYELSSKRASAVAALVADKSNVADDSIQAVYFGQTDRFDAEKMAPNRVVEVWEVR